MASTKDILDGQRFNRQRLVTAFMAGMPGGRELTPVRPWRGIITGLVLTVILVVGAAISKLFLPTLPNGWNDGKLVISSDNGSRYISISGKLYPIRNAASAHLLYPGVKTVSASDDALAKVELGPVVGIPGAPDKIPDAKKIKNARLTSCVANDGLLWTGVNLGTTKPAGADGALVTNAEKSYIVIGQYRYSFNQANSSTDQKVAARAVMNEFGFSEPPSVEAPSSWVNLFKEGEPLVPLEIPDAGSPSDAIPGTDGLKIGMVVEVSNGVDKDNRYIVRKEGLERMTPTMRHMYAMSPTGSKAETKKLTSHEVGQAKFAENKLRPTWPKNITGLLDAPDKPCARAETGGSTTLAKGSGIPTVTHNTVSVASQSGALLTQPGKGANLYYLIDEDGLAYKLGSLDDAGKAFGYTQVTPLKASAAWVNLFSNKQDTATPTLSSEAAWKTVPEKARKNQQQNGGSSGGNQQQSGGGQQTGGGGSSGGGSSGGGQQPSGGSS